MGAGAPLPAGRRLGLAACAAPALAILVGLGLWQLDRLAWKEALIAERERRLAAAPVRVGDVPAAAWRRFEHGRVVLSGRYLHDREMLVLNRVRRGRAGFGLVTPMLLEAGGAVLVDRGWVPPGWREAAGPRPRGVVEAAGVLRAGGPTSRWVPDNDPAADAWFHVDPAAMAARAGLAGAKPFHVRLAARPGAHPRGYPVRPDLPNRHLGYALTWFALAAALAAVWLLLHLRRRG